MSEQLECISLDRIKIVNYHTEFSRLFHFNVDDIFGMQLSENGDIFFISCAMENNANAFKILLEM